jgi:hypothetical protein
MRLRVFLKNIEFSSNIECFIIMRLEGVSHLLSPGHEINVHVSYDKNFKTLIELDNTHHRFTFSAEAETLSESCSSAMHLIGHFLREQQRINKKKFNKFFGEIN